LEFAAGVSEAGTVLDGDTVGEGEGLAVSAGRNEACKPGCSLALGEEMAIACVELKTGRRVHPAKIPANISSTPAAKNKIDIRENDAPNIHSSMA
jgi:hypothetical protein